MSNPFNTNRLLAVLVLGCFTLNCINPGWSSVAVLVAALGFTGFVVWLDPFKKNEISREEFTKLFEQVHKLREDLNATRMKIGFR